MPTPSDEPSRSFTVNLNLIESEANMKQCLQIKPMITDYSLTEINLIEQANQAQRRQPAPKTTSPTPGCKRRPHRSEGSNTANTKAITALHRHSHNHPTIHAQVITLPSTNPTSAALLTTNLTKISTN